jgi:hypothetical protein
VNDADAACQPHSVCLQPGSVVGVNHMLQRLQV